VKPFDYAAAMLKIQRGCLKLIPQSLERNAEALACWDELMGKRE